MVLFDGTSKWKALISWGGRESHEPERGLRLTDEMLEPHGPSVEATNDVSIFGSLFLSAVRHSLGGSAHLASGFERAWGPWGFHAYVAHELRPLPPTSSFALSSSAIRPSTLAESTFSGSRPCLQERSDAGVSKRTFEAGRFLYSAVGRNADELRHP